MRERRDFVEWARDTALHVDLRNTARADLSRLDPLLEGKRIAYLGEAPDQADALFFVRTVTPLRRD